MGGLNMPVREYSYSFDKDTAKRRKYQEAKKEIRRWANCRHHDLSKEHAIVERYRSK